MNMDLSHNDVFTLRYRLDNSNLPDNPMAMVFKLAVDGFREDNNQRRHMG
jgi:hypothetical protein